MKKPSYIIWDWNGTLFNDVDVCISVMNDILKDKKLKVIPSKDVYRKLFCFPVIEYYQKLGFDFSLHSFESLAKIYVEAYQANIKQCDLYDGALTVLQKIKQSDIKQVILSASKTEHLLEQMSPFPISDYFEDVLGLDNYYAKSKIEVGKHWIGQNSICGEDIVLIGDTIHDYEVSAELGCNCILIANGHQSRTVLSNCNCCIVDTIREILAYINLAN